MWCESKSWCLSKNLCESLKCNANIKTCIRDSHHYIFYIARFGNVK